MTRYDTQEARFSCLVRHPANGAHLFLQPRSRHGALTYKSTSR